MYDEYLDADMSNADNHTTEDSKPSKYDASAASIETPVDTPQPSESHPKPTAKMREVVEDDDVIELIYEYSLDPDETKKPVNFPTDFWKYVRDSERDQQIKEWSTYPPERMAYILKEIPKLNVNTKRPNQEKYCRAFASILKTHQFPVIP